MATPDYRHGLRVPGDGFRVPILSVEQFAKVDVGFEHRWLLSQCVAIGLLGGSKFAQFLQRESEIVQYHRVPGLRCKCGSIGIRRRTEISIATQEVAEPEMRFGCARCQCAGLFPASARLFRLAVLEAQPEHVPCIGIAGREFDSALRAGGGVGDRAARELCARKSPVQVCARVIECGGFLQLGHRRRVAAAIHVDRGGQKQRVELIGFDG